jgi:hypothetical protein
VNPFPLQPEAPELPETASVPSHTETSALPGTPPSPVAATEQNPAPVQEIRHEVFVCTKPCYLLVPDTPNSAMLLF